jgi:hypothetical protein
MFTLQSLDAGGRYLSAVALAQEDALFRSRVTDTVTFLVRVGGPSWRHDNRSFKEMVCVPNRKEQL